SAGSNSINVLAGNGDGTFQAPRQFDVGPGLAAGSLSPDFRTPGIADVNGDGVPDVIVPNLLSGDVSVLLGNEDGTLQPQRRFAALPFPDSMATGDFTGDGKTDLVVLENSLADTAASFAFLRGRGDGTFAPAVFTSTVFQRGAGPILAGGFDGNG